MPIQKLQGNSTALHLTPTNATAFNRRHFESTIPRVIIHIRAYWRRAPRGRRIASRYGSNKMLVSPHIVCEGHAIAWLDTERWRIDHRCPSQALWFGLSATLLFELFLKTGRMRLLRRALWRRVH
jgi:hypothetical protein